MVATYGCLEPTSAVNVIGALEAIEPACALDLRPCTVGGGWSYAADGAPTDPCLADPAYCVGEVCWLVLTLPPLWI